MCSFSFFSSGVSLIFLYLTFSEIVGRIHGNCSQARTDWGCLELGMRTFTVLLAGFLLGVACSASAFEGTFLYVENGLNQPITSEPVVKPTLITVPQLELSMDKLVFLENLSDATARAFPFVPSDVSAVSELVPITSGLVPAVSAFAPLMSGSVFAVSDLPFTESELAFTASSASADSEGAKLEIPHFPSYLTEEDILECSTSYHGLPLKLTRAAFLRLDIDGEEWFGIMSDELPAPPPRNLVTALTEIYTALEITDICNDLLAGRHETPKGVFRMGVPEPASWVLFLLALVGSVYCVSRKSK